MIIFSDELNFEIINRKNKKFVRRKNTEKYLKQHIQSRIQKGGGSVGIWGYISGLGVDCHKIYEGRLNQYGCRDILESSLIPSRDIFQPDQNKTMLYVIHHIQSSIILLKVIFDSCLRQHDHLA